MLACGISLAAISVLPSCVDPYYAGGPTQRSVTHYQVGYETRSLPSGYRTEVIGGERYYLHDNTYYRPRGNRYVVVEPPRSRYSRTTYTDRSYGNGPFDRRETIIRELPRGYRTVQHRGVTYYQIQDRYYQRSGSGYVVVDRPY